MSIYKPLSYWEIDTWFGNLDIIIIGGGIVGMNAAIRLAEKEPKLRIAMVERSSLGTAASTRNAGFACYGSISEIVDDLKHMDADEVFQLVAYRVKGLEVLKSIVGVENMQYQQVGGYEMFIDENEFQTHLSRINEVNRELKKISPDLLYRHVRKNHSLRNIKGVIGNSWEAQIHPGEMVKTLRSICDKKGIRIITNAEVSCISPSETGFQVQISDLSMHSKHVIVANNGFASQLIDDIQVNPARNLVLLTNRIEGLSINGCYHYDKGYVYFRNVGERVLIGGGRNLDTEGETTTDFGSNNNIEKYLL
ncbi:MAG: FAD-binding oxidoreductase, partial [Bacteroidia bacterium]|nr:FAD-binding oxidoreductase [Bacteroidia bacterium]